MIGLDSNILLRYVTQDDPLQSAQAAHVMEHRLTKEELTAHWDMLRQSDATRAEAAIWAGGF